MTAAHVSALCVSIMLLGGCTVSRKIDPSNVDIYVHQFEAGTVAMDTSVGKAGASGWYADRAQLLYIKRKWVDLAKLIIELDYGDDIDWFYLGEAARWLGYKDAAAQYYLNSTNTIFRMCEPGANYLPGNCNGIELPSFAEQALNKLGYDVVHHH